MAVADVPEELIAEILSRLPAKSLCRFRCVCKPWCNLISDFGFTKMHLSRAIERGDLSLIATKTQRILKEKKECSYSLLSQDGHEIHSPGCIRTSLSQTYIYSLEQDNSFEKALKVKDPLGERFGMSRLLGSCNGVICLVRDTSNELCLLNPYTREYKIARYEKELNFGHSAVYGLGYDAKNEDYNLVWFGEKKDHMSEINVYSLGNASWLKIPSVPYCILGQPVIFLNGTLHWVGRNMQKCHYEIIVSFDIGEKVVQEIPTPENVVSLDADDDDSDSDSYYDFDFDSCLTLGLVGGKLATFKGYPISNNIEIWVMRNYGSRDSWFKLFSIKDDVRRSVCNQRSLYFDCGDSMPFYFTKNAEVLVKTEENLFWYDLKEKTARNLKIHGISSWSKMGRVIVIHVASLVSLKSGTYAESVIGVEEEEQDVKPVFCSYIDGNRRLRRRLTREAEEPGRATSD